MLESINKNLRPQSINKKSQTSEEDLGPYFYYYYYSYYYYYHTRECEAPLLECEAPLLEFIRDWAYTAKLKLERNIFNTGAKHTLLHSLIYVCNEKWQLLLPLRMPGHRLRLQSLIKLRHSIEAIKWPRSHGGTNNLCSSLCVQLASEHVTAA